MLSLSHPWRLGYKVGLKYFNKILDTHWAVSQVNVLVYITSPHSVLVTYSELQDFPVPGVKLARKLASSPEGAAESNSKSYEVRGTGRSHMESSNAYKLTLYIKVIKIK